jgi:hypothetical protein
VVETPSRQCKYSENGAHYYKKLVGSIWRCDYCLFCKWLPNSTEEAAVFSFDIRRYGYERAYAKYLGSKPRVSKLLDELNNTRVLIGSLPKETVDKIMSDIVTEKVSLEVALEDNLTSEQNNRALALIFSRAGATSI